MKMIIYVKDIFLRTKVEDLARQISSIEFSSIDSLDNLSDFDYLIIDLEDEVSLGLIEKHPEKIVCFCSHVKMDLINNAKKLGCRNVFARSFFFNNFHKIVVSLVSKVIIYEELKNLVSGHKDYFLIDVREKEELVYGMIPTAKHVPLTELDEVFEMDDLRFKEKYGFKKFTKNDLVIFHCRTGGRSSIATELARKKGFLARNYAGSIWEWAQYDSNVQRYGPSHN